MTTKTATATATFVANRAAELAYLISEIEHLGNTDTPQNIAKRLGYRQDSLSRRLERAGRYDLAARFTTRHDKASE